MITLCVKPTWKFYIGIIFTCTLFYLHVECMDSIGDQCKRKCDKEVAKDTDDLFCNIDCKRCQCYWGCDNYEKAVNSTCQRLCGDQHATQDGCTITTRPLQKTERQFCNLGCRSALESYTKFMEDAMKPLRAPELKTGQKSHSFVVLRWEGSLLPNVTHYLQARLIDVNGNWNINSALWDMTSGDINVTDLQPYATYKFRILIEITSTSYISTPETEPITTLPKGAPSAPPTILEILAPTPSVISVTWAPPIFVNGPLLGYRLHLQPVNHTDLHSTMREVQGNVTSWTFRQLQPSQYYVLSVSAWNRDGEGGADTASVITPNPGNLSTEEMPFLILGEDNKVLKHQLTDLFTTPYPLQKIEPRTSMVRGAEILYESSNSVNMSGIGLHIRRQILLVSDSGNNVWLVDVTQKNAQRRTCSNLQEPSAVTVDWLNDVAYIVDGNYIYRCDFVKDKVMPAAGPLPTVPKEIKVDPLSGFIYFTQSDQNIGIFRIDIGLIQPNYTVPYSQVIKSHLNTFSIDHNNLQLYFPNETQNTMMSSFLDGTGTIDLRKNKVIRPNYYGIVSMVYYNGLFYWTTGTDVLKEDYDKSNDTFYLNPMLFFNHHYVAFNIYQQSVQPKPVPHSPPQRLQALFVANKVYIQWQAPKILTFQGIGAWKKWQYDVFISEKDGSSTQIIEKVDVTYSEVLNLVQDTSYIVKVRARSEDKVGSWSSPFLGRTLTEDAAKARLVIASGFPRTLVTEVNMYREEVKTLTQMMFTDVQDMVWMKDLIVMATGNDLKLYNITSGYLMSLTLDALSVAYDWLGDKLYWSSAELGQIKRADLGQENSDFVTQGKARRMSIDAVAGRLYWATESSIESCFLNGEDHVKYFSLPYFSGKQVISMTLNFDQRKILWYVRGYDLQDLYMADLIQGTTNGEVPSFQRVGSFDSISDTSNLQYYSHRIFWQNKDGAVTVGDLDVNHTSVISPPGVSVFSVHHSTMQPYPAGFNRTTTKVIPNAITADSIICVGKWNKFNLTWSRSTVTHGDIRYEVSVVYNKKGHIVQTENNWYEMSGVLPYSLMKVTLRSHTYWGYSPATAVSVRSPMSVPSAPLTPRVYVTQHKNSAKSEKSLAADFRWSTPETSNGIIVRYIIHYRHLNNGQTTPLPPVSRHFIQNHLRPNVTYHFQVRACTDVGCGNFSDTVSARADAVNPVPKLLMATMDKVELAEVDSNSDASVAMVSNIKPKTLTFLAQDERLFWTDDSNHLYEGGKQGSGAASSTRLLSINGTVKDMNIDWISRTLYIVVHHNSGMTSTILAYLLDQRVHKIIENRPVTITSIAVEPYTSTIFWTEYQAGTNKNKIYKLTNDNEAQLLFLMRKKRATSDACNCSSVQFGNVMTTDYSGNDEMGILIYDSQSNSMVATDASSCYCRIIVSQSPGFPPDLLAVDHLHIYWYNKQNNLLYIYDKVTKKIEQMSINGLQDMIAYGSHLQPLPSSECLDPGAYNKTISVTAVTNVTLSVQLDKVTWNKSCKGISRPATKYTVYIKEASKTGQTRCNLGNLDCTNKTSYDRDIVLTGLKPYREYVVQAAVSNYYTEYLSEALSQPHMFKTAIGVPSAVKDVTLMVYTPYSLIVRWKQPLELNGPEDGLRYVIKYSTKINDVKFEGLVNSTKDSKRADACEVLEVEGICIKLENLVAGHLYEVKVLSSNMEELYYSESKTFFVTTYMTPSPLNVTGATHNSINVSWAIPEDNSTRAITYNFRKTTSTIWKQSWMEWNVPNKNVTVLNHTYSNLEPYTEYDMVIRINFQSGGNTDWPAGNPLTYRTLAYIPVAPEPPVIKELTSVSGHEIIWTPPRDNGEPIIFYTLQYFKEGQNQWLPAYNGSDPRWLVDQKIIPPDEVYFFRVAAMNAIGLSEFSANSSQFTYLSADDPGDINMAILASAFSVIFLLVVVAIMIACCVMRRRRFEKQKPTQFIAVARGPDMELATLRELPHTAIQQSNTLYAINIIPTDEDIAALPHFMRDQLTLTKFLGSGAFGEVFEGIARNILSDSSGETKVAVKTLRKSASDQEKEEFLKEALLMSNFKHQHILSLLGVCLNNDPQFIILELMEGGDLLSFLRGCRSSINHMYLSLADLIKICVHVARGCKYLEEMHFVHRDLAARNCLVSSKNPAELCVKIGDFGLARDIYKNDYYRKEGEGLLPVRWMSPESLVDGVFTTQSDIWAFGVLMWEVLTFGQQPYPARTNLEVLHFVRSGGQLDKPDNCPQDTFYLMKKCWSADIEDRPSFSHILQTLEEFHQKCIALQSEYIMPIHSNRPPETSEADGFERGQRVKRKKREKQRTSSLGHDSIQRDPASLYRRIHRSTSFDSPEPREVKCEYLSPKTSGVPTYLELISDPSDPPPPETFIHKSRSRKLSSQNSRHASVSSRNTSVSSRHSSCSSDTFCHPMESRLTVNLPASSNEDTGCYKHVHSIDSVSGSEFPYASVSRSIPEERDEVFEESDKCFKLPEGYDFVPAPLRNMRSPSEGSRNVRHLSDIDQRMRNPSDSSQRSTPMIDMPEGYTFVPAQYGNKVSNTILPEGYDYVPPTLHSNSNLNYLNGYSVIKSPQKQVHTAGTREAGYMVVKTPAKSDLLSASSSDDVKMSQISLFSPEEDKSASDTQQDKSSYVSYDPACIPTHGNIQKVENNYGISNSAEMYIKYDNEAIYCERPYNSAEARLVFTSQKEREKNMLNNNKQFSRNLAINDANYVDCNTSKSYLSLSSMSRDSLMEEPVKYIVTNNNVHLPTVHSDLDNRKVFKASKCQVYPVDKTSPRQGYPCNDDVIQFASLV